MEQMTTSNQLVTTDTLVQHVSKPEWGLALLAWEREDKRGYQFEDGQLRIFKKGYFDFIQPIDRPVDETARVRAELSKKLGRRKAAVRNGSTHTPISFAEQLEYFRVLYPDTFMGAKWTVARRGAGAKKRLKRHSDPAIASAGELFSAERLEAKLAAGEALSVVAELAELMDAIDLVSKAQLRGFNRASEENAVRLVRALIQLSWGEGELAGRFNRWVAALGRCLGKKASWAIATAIPTLIAPTEHCCIHRTTCIKQAAWMAPNLVIELQPRGSHYVRLVEMMTALSEKLAEAGASPRDLLDVYDFIQMTLRPKAIKEILEMRATAEKAIAVVPLIEAEASDKPDETRDELALAA